ncbi:MAG: TIGR00730 family Rossman fold protein [Spirochaetales bacterium]|nr:TIGR00730 family Rossman fold protein [Spirochaetales bacterium]
MQIETVGIFCGSSTGSNNIYREETIKLADYLAQNGKSLVYGGGTAGLMGVLAGRMLEKGCRVTGVIPEMIQTKVGHLPLTETIVTPDMHSRKRKMYDISDCFIALPGGIGTIEEISEAFTWQQLGYHSKAVSLYNINNFFKYFDSFLEAAEMAGFIKNVHRSRLIIESEPARLLEKLESYDGTTIDKWS